VANATALLFVLVAGARRDRDSFATLRMTRGSVYSRSPPRTGSENVNMLPCSRVLSTVATPPNSSPNAGSPAAQGRCRLSPSFESDRPA
jgi:hypothetical protein